MKFYLPSISKAAAIAGLLASLTGCSVLNIGADEYGCSGMPNGVQCMSARDVYVATNNGQVPAPMIKGKEVEKDGNSQKKTDDSAHANESGDAKQAKPNDVVDNYVSPRLPDRPIPIRTPAQVMRIWVAPWEDTIGDLITTGYIYTEIEPRRWVIGEQMTASDPVLRPLQSLDVPASAGNGVGTNSVTREERLERAREEREVRQEQIQRQREQTSLNRR